MIYMTGDTHAEFIRFERLAFPQQAEMSKEDYVIICGDFGGVWNDSPQQQRELDWLDDLPFTTLFITGNHENYDLLATYPVSEWHGGKVQFIRPSVIHLMRGQVFDIDGKTFFTMGGAACHDIYNGVLDRESSDFEERFARLRAQRKFFRVNHESWWEQELPTQQELDEGWENLHAHGDKVDCILSHCAPTGVQRKISRLIFDDSYPENRLTEFLQQVYDTCTFTHWYCGHYHRTMNIDGVRVRYQTVERLGDASEDSEGFEELYELLQRMIGDAVKKPS